MDNSQVTVKDGKYCRKCASCRSWTRCDTLRELQMAFTGTDGKPFKSCNKCRSNRVGKGQTRRIDFDLDKSYESREEFVDDVCSFLEEQDTHIFEASRPSLRIKATLSSSVLLDNDISVGICTQTADRELQKRAARLLRNDIFDCTGYYFHMRRVNERQDGPRFNMTCSSSKDRKFERDVSKVRRYTEPKVFFECCGEIHITLSKMHESAIIIYEHNGRTESPKFHVTEEIHNYIKEQKNLPPRQIYWNLIQLADDPRFKKTELHTITRQQVYNVWLSHTKTQWERDNADDFRSAQLLIAEQDGYHLVEELQETGVSLALTTPCFSNYGKYDRGKMTEIFIDSTFGTNKHGYELYCVLAEYDLVSLPLSYLFLDTRNVKEDGKRGIRLTRWFAALRDAGLNPNVVHTDKDFAEVTAASIVFKPNNPAYNHHLCLWHSLRAIDQQITGKVKDKGHASTIVGNSIRTTALPEYLHFLSDERDWILSKGQNKRCSTEQAQKLRSMIKEHLLRHPLLPKVVDDKKAAPGTLQFESYEEIHGCSIKEMLEYCRTIDQPKLFRYFWANWYRPSFGNVGSRWEIASLCGRRGSDASIPISRTTMRLESHWRILKKDYASRFTRPRLDVLTYRICTGLVHCRMHLHTQVEAGRKKPSAYNDFVHLWRVCACAVDSSVISDRDEVYHADRGQWVCSCPSFILNARYICKHLVSFYCHQDC